MLRLCVLARCVPSGTSLTSRLTQLTQRVEQHIMTDKCLSDASGTTGSLWEEVLSTAKCASALKETDTMLAIVFRLLRCKCYPPCNTAWPELIRYLAPYSDIEANAVLAYPGVQDTSGCQRGVAKPRQIFAAAFCNEADMADFPPLLQPTRETLLMTGGVVPLSARVPCSDGGALSRLVEAFCDVCGAPHCADGDGGGTVSAACVRGVASAVITALQPIAGTVSLAESSSLSLALMRLFGLLFSLQSFQVKGETNGAEEFAEQLSQLLSDNALGARAVLMFLAEQHVKFPDAMMHLPLIRIAARGVWKRYETHSMLSSLRHAREISEAVDVTLQRNANNGNPLGITEAEEVNIRLLLSLVLLRVMRVEAVSPDAFLRDAVDIVERCPMNLSVEYELLVAKVKLLDLFVDDEASSSAIYDDMLHSLRAMVEIRPRDSGTGEVSAMNDAVYYFEDEDEKKLSRHHFQEAHRLVVAAFARSNIEERLNQAYTILVTHKYHGLVITKEVANPLIDVLSRRGDCRVFNIVDLCVLYSGSRIDYDTLTYLFKACRVAGDFYRARTLYQLLREMIPGFLLRAPTAITDALRDLKILPLEPANLFPASLAVDGDDAVAAVAYEGVIDDEALAACQRGPIRELPAKQTHVEK